MKKTLNIVLIAIIACILVSCNKHEHQGGEWQVIEEPTCSKAGKKVQFCLECGEEVNSVSLSKLEHKLSDWEMDTPVTCTKNGLNKKTCLVCNEIVRYEKVESTGHKYVYNSLECINCNETMKEYTSFQDYMTHCSYYNGTYEYTSTEISFVINLNSFHMEDITYLFPSNIKYVRIVGNADQTYNNVRFVVDPSSSGITLDFVNVNIYSTNTIITNNNKNDLRIGFYGTKNSLITKDGVRGADGPYIGRDAENGTSSSNVIDTFSTVSIECASNVIIKGGKGGDGGNGRSDSFAPLVGGDGGNGGNGGTGIVARDIIISFLSGYTKNNITITGGAAGTGGNGGEGGLFADDGDDGISGTSGKATSVAITYK